ncbi:hypothetical protein [Micromonospora sp. NPDC000207]|uniref:hypothetical protein n=1 Tax=unclassified Micromonospora TaxID=2617518 RepID=UPI003317771E
MISNSEMIRIRRQMQRRIQDVVAERRRTRLAEEVTDPVGEAADRPTDPASLTPTH